MSTELYPFIARVLQYWRSRGVPYLPGVSEAEIVTFEQQKKLRLPEELRAFYRATNGLRVPGSPEVDDMQYDFWPLYELHGIPEGSSMLYFADVLQSSYQFAIECRGDNDFQKGSVFVVPGEPIKLASTFGEFIELYMRDDLSLYPISWYKP
jgi:SMI1 / KNR4 family (SUKH-1)